MKARREGEERGVRVRVSIRVRVTKGLAKMPSTMLICPKFVIL